MINLVPLECHGQVDYYNGIYFRKKELKLKKNEDIQLFMSNSYKMQVLVTNSSILSDHENVVFNLIYKIFPKI